MGNSIVIDGNKSSGDNKNELKITNHCKVMFGEMGDGASYSDDDLVSSLPVCMKQQGAPTNGFWGATAGRECQGDSSNLSRVFPQRDFIVNANTNHRPMLSDMSTGTEVSFAHVPPKRLPFLVAGKSFSPTNFLLQLLNTHSRPPCTTWTGSSKESWRRWLAA